MLADTHVHLSRFSFDGSFSYLRDEGEELIVVQRGTREELIEQLRASGVVFCVEPGVEAESNEQLLRLAHRLPGFLYPAVGIHPTRLIRRIADGKRVKALGLRDWLHLRKLADDPAVTAIGETGLDYHLPRREQHRFRQQLWFAAQLLLAHRLQLPVILHIRQADRAALRMLRLFRGKLHGGVCHCFCGDAAAAGQYTALGLALGIGGALLQKSERCAGLEEAIRRTPLSQLVLETDAPYVRPERGTIPGRQWKRARNTGLTLPAVARRIAELKGISVEEVERITTENARRIFRIKAGAEAPRTE